MGLNGNQYCAKWREGEEIDGEPNCGLEANQISVLNRYSPVLINPGTLQPGSNAHRKPHPPPTEPAIQQNPIRTGKYLY